MFCILHCIDLQKFPLRNQAGISPLTELVWLKTKKKQKQKKQKGK